MTAPRKKWRITTWSAGGPTGPTSCSSQRDAYQRIQQITANPSRVNTVVVEVSEDGGKTWQLYEQLLRSRGDF